jgi:Tfp pilus assembly protein PilN
MKVRLNLATVPLESNRRFAAAAYIVGGLGVIAMVVLSWHGYAAWRSNTASRLEEAQLQANMQQLRNKQSDLQIFFDQPDTKQRRDLSAFLNGLIAERAFPWTKIFMDLEQTLPPGVRVVSISPRLINGRAEVTLEVAAETDTSKIDFLEAVEKSTVFSGMVVKEEKRADQPGAADKIVLSLTVWYTTT